MFCCTWFSQPLIATLHSDLPDQWNWTSDNPTGKNNRHESSIKKQCRTCVFNQNLAVWQDFAAWTRVVGFPLQKVLSWKCMTALSGSDGKLGVLGRACCWTAISYLQRGAHCQYGTSFQRGKQATHVRHVSEKCIGFYLKWPPLSWAFPDVILSCISFQCVSVQRLWSDMYLYIYMPVYIRIYWYSYSIVTGISRYINV